MTFAKGDRDAGRVITGSSNFTEAGLIDNLEFNVELKNRADYEFAKNKFEYLWKDAFDVSEKYIETIEGKTWLNQNITPYQLYLKCLYEYFKDELGSSEEVLAKYSRMISKGWSIRSRQYLTPKRYWRNMEAYSSPMWLDSADIYCRAPCRTDRRQDSCYRSSSSA